MPEIGRGGGGWSGARTVMPLDGNGAGCDDDVDCPDWAEGKPLQLPMFDVSTERLDRKSVV